MSPPLTPLERLRASGITPDRALGQNFLIDPNILDVIEKLAVLGADDVVLEVGPGLGVLTERLLERCCLVHCVELDSRLERMLTQEFGASAKLRLYREDAMRFDLEALDPPPSKFVANLPYNVATPLIIRSIETLAPLQLWCLMVQKEIADRLFAAPGSANYGGVSVMVQLTCQKISARPVSPSVFYPPPRVNSALLAFRRRAPGYGARHFTVVKKLVYAAFSHRRKQLVNSVAGAAAAQLPAQLAGRNEHRRKELMESLLAHAGLPVNIRPQDLRPRDYEKLAQMLARESGEPNE